MNPLVLLLAAGAVLALAGRRKGSIQKCMWSEEHRGYCYSAHHELLVTSRFGFAVWERAEGEDPLFKSGLDYPSESSAAQAARGWIDYRLDG